MTRQNARLDPKDVGETDVITFDFSLVLNTGETIVTAVVTSEVYAGVDPTPTALLFGPVQVTGLVVAQQIQAGLVGVEYLLRCTITTSAARTLVLSALLPVIRI